MKARTFARVAAILLVAAVGIGIVSWITLRQHLATVPDFYERALEPALLDEGERLEHRLEQTGDAIQQAATWELELGEAALNAWLAKDLARQFPKLIPITLQTPRVMIDTDNVWLGVTYEEAGWHTVVSLQLQLTLGSRPNVIECQVASVRAGSVPLPLRRILEPLRQESRRGNWPVHWSERGGLPVAEITIPTQHADWGSRRLVLEQLQLRRGAVLLRGSSVAAPLDAAPPTPLQDRR